MFKYLIGHIIIFYLFKTIVVLIHVAIWTEKAVKILNCYI